MVCENNMKSCLEGEATTAPGVMANSSSWAQLVEAHCGECTALWASLATWECHIATQSTHRCAQLTE